MIFSLLVRGLVEDRGDKRWGDVEDVAALCKEGGGSGVEKLYPIGTYSGRGCMEAVSEC